VSFDDPKSLSYKLYYLLLKHKLNGVTLWSLDFDDFTGNFCNAGKYPFLRQVACTIEAVESRLPPATCRVPVNVGFLLDSSLHAGWNYPKLKKFVKIMAASFGISAFGTKASVATFSTDAENAITFDDNYDSYSFNAQVDAIPLMGTKKRRMDTALQLANKDMFTADNGAEFGAPNVLVLLTVGSQHKGEGDPAAMAKQLRASGVHLVVVGVGRHVDRNELEIIAGDTQDVFIAPTYGQLLGKDFVSSVSERLCPQV